MASLHENAARNEEAMVLSEGSMRPRLCGEIKAAKRELRGRRCQTRLEHEAPGHFVVLLYRAAGNAI